MVELNLYVKSQLVPGPGYQLEEPASRLWESCRKRL